MITKKCDICGNEFETGICLKVKKYEFYRLFGQWITLPVRKKIRICTKCEEIGQGLIRNYRKERL